MNKSLFRRSRLKTTGKYSWLKQKSITELLAIEFKLDFSGAADYSSLCKCTSVTKSQQNKENSLNGEIVNPICTRIINEWAGDCGA